MAVVLGFGMVICGFSMLKEHTGVGLLLVIFGGGLLTAIANIS